MKESDVILCGHGSGNPRTIKASTYNSQRYSQKVTKTVKDAQGREKTITWRKGLVAVMRPKALTDKLRPAYKAKYSTILGRNYYSQAKRKYCYKKYSDGLYYSDCSSSQMLTFAEIGLDMPTYNTVEIYESSKFTKVDVTIKDGHVMDPEKLKVGDQFLYAGADPDRLLHIGHVEGVYSIAEQASSTVTEFQQFMNRYYGPLLKECFGETLEVDGDYGYKTRAASVCVWKYMVVKYYGFDLTPSNPNFFSASMIAADYVSNAEIKKHSTFGYILNGILAGKGYKTKATGDFTDATRQAVLDIQKANLINQTGRMNGQTWYYIFN